MQLVKTELFTNLLLGIKTNKTVILDNTKYQRCYVAEKAAHMLNIEHCIFSHISQAYI